MNPQLYLPDKLFPKGLTEIGSGADGTVYETSSNEIIKVSVHVNWDYHNIYDSQKTILSNLAHIEKNSPCHLVKIYDIGKINYITKFKSIHGDLDAYIYSYSMERLIDLSEDERRIWDSISHRDTGDPVKITKQTFENTKTLCDFYNIDFKKPSFFLKCITQSNIIHLDVHPRNIMKDNENNYKLIDLDRISIQP